MKRFLTKVLPIFIIGICASWLAYNYFSSPKIVDGNHFQPVVPISKIQLSDVDEVRAALTDPKRRSEFDKWSKSTANNIEVISAEITDGNVVYNIYLMPDMLQVRYKRLADQKTVTILDDYDFDGVVDYAVTKESGKQIRVFDLEKGTGLQLRRSYQDLYQDRISRLASMVGR